MKTKRFSVLQLILAVLLTSVVLTGGGLLALRAVVARAAWPCWRACFWSTPALWETMTPPRW